MSLTKSRKEQVAWWASKVYEQAQMYADLEDPTRKKPTDVSNKLDAIAEMCKQLHFQLTSKPLKSLDRDMEMTKPNKWPRRCSRCGKGIERGTICIMCDMENTLNQMCR